MGKSLNRSDRLDVEDVQEGMVEKWAMHFDAVDVGTECQTIQRVIFGPSLESVDLYRSATGTAKFKKAVPVARGSCACGQGSVIFVKEDGSVDIYFESRWVQVTERDERGANALSIPLTISHHKFERAMPKPYRAQLTELRGKCAGPQKPTSKKKTAK